MYAKLPGLSQRASEFVIDLAAEEFAVTWDAKMGRRKALSWLGALRLCLVRLRQNNTFEELAETFAISNTTACDYFHHMCAFLAGTIGCSLEDLKDRVSGKVHLVDGTLVPTWNWRHRKDLYSGKHKRYGANVIIVADIHGRVAAASKPYPGSWHDKHAYDEAGLDTILAGSGGDLGDPGFQGTNLTTPTKKPPGGQLTDKQKANNKRISTVRVGVEWCIAHVKNWRIMTTRYRGELTHRFDNVIKAATGLQRLNDIFSTRTLSFARLQKKEAVSG